MPESADRRQELGGFLRRRRESLNRSELGLPPVGRNKTLGLRREEVATFSGVSVTWYTWLEQGRDISPSRHVLDALASTLRLREAQHAYVLELCGFTAAPVAHPQHPPSVPHHLLDLLGSMSASPAFIVSASWHIAAWNPAYERLYPHISTVDAGERNLLWLIFTDPYVKRMLPDWEAQSRHFLAEFRAENGLRVPDADTQGVVARLRATSAHFRDAWDDHDVERFASRERRFIHPHDGEMTFVHHRLIPSDDPSLHLVVYTELGQADRSSPALHG